MNQQDLLDTLERLHKHKVRNLIQFMRRDGIILNTGSNKSPAWALSDEKVIAKRTKENPD